MNRRSATGASNKLTRAAAARRSANRRGVRKAARPGPFRTARAVRRSAPVRGIKASRQWGLHAGRADAAHDLSGEDYQKRGLNRLWLTRLRSSRSLGRSWPQYWAAAQAYAQGYSEKSGVGAKDWLMLPTAKTVGAVVTAMNEEAAIEGVLFQLQRMALEEIVVVVNGSGDGTFDKARSSSHAIVVHYDQALGYDVGRVIGAKLTRSDIVLFVDGDFPLPAEQLLPYIAAVDRGMDVALNDIMPYLRHYAKWDSVSVVKQFLNRALGRPDLSANSLTAVPHALSRRALETIGAEPLLVPPKAQALAIRSGLSVGAPWSVDVIKRNKEKAYNVGESNPVAEMIVGDHVEALAAVMKKDGPRLAFPDVIRKRNYLK